MDIIIYSFGYLLDLEFEFVKNDLYDLLESTLKGKIALNLYKKTKFLDITKVKDIFVYDTMEKSMNHKYK